MYFTSLRLQSFRNYASLDLAPVKGTTVLY